MPPPMPGAAAGGMPPLPMGGGPAPTGAPPAGMPGAMGGAPGMGGPPGADQGAPPPPAAPTKVQFHDVWKLLDKVFGNDVNKSHKGNDIRK